MTQSRLLDAVFAALMVLVAALFLPRLFVGDTSFFRRTLDERAVLVVGSLVKLACLLVAALWAGRIVPHFERGNPARPAWRLMQLGFACYFVAQLTLSSLNLLLANPPFPSPADPLFLLSTGLLIASLALAVRTYLGEHPEGSLGLALLPAGAALVVIVVFDYWLLRPILRAQAPTPEIIVNVAYPVFDSVLLVLAVALLRITLHFRGGRIWAVWLTLLAGFLFLCVGDIAYAFLSTMGMSHLDPIMDVMFVWSYALFARGILYQHELLGV